MPRRLPDSRRRSATLEVWLDEDAVDDLRLLAMRAGFSRRIAGSRPPVRRGDLSALIQDTLRRAADEPEAWRATLAALRREDDDEPVAPRVKIQMRVRPAWLARIRRLALDAGLVHGGRGNVSELIRRLLSLRTDG